MSFYTGKTIVVTGGTGMIGRRLCERLVEDGAFVIALSLDDRSRAANGVRHFRCDLTRSNDLQQFFGWHGSVDMVFHVAGVKGSAGLGVSRAADWLVPMLEMNTNVMEAARLAKVERMLLTSSSAVYPYSSFTSGAPDEKMARFGPPHELYAGTAKRVMELQARAYKEQYGWDKIAVVRLANVYGPWDNFDPLSAMAIPALIARAAGGENPLTVWGSPDTERDYLYVDDCVEGMLLAMEYARTGTPFNLGSGYGIPMEAVALRIASYTGAPLVWSDTASVGLKRKVLNCSQAKAFMGWEARTPLAQGISKTYHWYVEHQDIANKRHNVMTSP